MKFDVQKSTTIDAPLAKVRALVEDFNQWNSWSPWTIVEPDCSVTVSGNPGEIGHSMSWDGAIIGSGKNTLSSSKEHQFHYDLAFFKPWKSQAKVNFLFEESDGQTKVTWTMNSSMPFFMFFMIKTMKNWIGMDYDRGLRMLKEMAEKGEVNCKTVNQGTVAYEGFSYIGLERTVAVADMPATMAKDFEKLVNDIVVVGQKGAKHWVCIYPKFDMKTMQATYIAAVSDEDLSSLSLGPEYITGKINDASALEIKHDGAYDFIGNAWSMGMMYMRAKKLKGKGFPFEQYWNSPMEVAAEELKTSIYFPLKK